MTRADYKPCVAREGLYSPLASCTLDFLFPCLVTDIRHMETEQEPQVCQIWRNRQDATGEQQMRRHSAFPLILLPPAPTGHCGQAMGRYVQKHQLFVHRLDLKKAAFWGEIKKNAYITWHYRTPANKFNKSKKEWKTTKSAIQSTLLGTNGRGKLWKVCRKVSQLYVECTHFHNWGQERKCVEKNHLSGRTLREAAVLCFLPVSPSPAPCSRAVFLFFWNLSHGNK